ncbi:hypothetical protein BLX88_05940 [Bacillus obstructivus]|uniref:hypothetical protein n=1 Tax=Heyndrickxia oleronia TaxID=38875 RepID=UPI0009035112|nr:hypothetical protein [Heyndrickxia oleronia]OJH19809.1 hypothetical protein BLX88_05940 [Bacillus obstructivus]GIN41701.1 hypothetical protein J19TS1_46500 [Heyndrickxia oleronia]
MFEITNINLDHIKINSSDHGSSISFGSTVMIGKRVYAKKNQAFGQNLADSIIQLTPVSITIDDDLEDTFSSKHSL